MKLFIDRKKREFVKSAASNVVLDRLVLKRRDLIPLEYVFCENGKALATPAGTAITCALKLNFNDANFLALASGEPPTLNLNTVPLEASFSTGKASLPALIEIRWTVPGETTRTATLTAEIQNSVILGNEGTPESIPDARATQGEAETGTNNTKWMTPLRTAQAIAAQQDIEQIFNSSRSSYYHEINYTLSGDISNIQVYANASKTVHLYSRVFTYDGSGNITTITTTDQQVPGVSLTKTITYSGSGDIATVTRNYYGV